MVDTGQGTDEPSREPTQGWVSDGGMHGPGVLRRRNDGGAGAATSADAHGQGRDK